MSTDWISLGAKCSDVAAAIGAGLAMQDSCESPIEFNFGGALAARCEGTKAQVQPQYRLDRFRYDFALVVEGFERPVLLVECDGQAFHSTEEAIANDALKDAAAKAEGIPLVRFTGSEINHDAGACADKALAPFLSAIKA